MSTLSLSRLQNTLRLKSTHNTLRLIGTLSPSTECDRLNRSPPVMFTRPTGYSIASRSLVELIKCRLSNRMQVPNVSKRQRTSPGADEGKVYSLHLLATVLIHRHEGMQNSYMSGWKTGRFPVKVRCQSFRGMSSSCFQLP